MVSPDSNGISRAPPYLGSRLREHSLSLTGLSPSSAGFPNTVQLKNAFVTLRYVCRHSRTFPQPPMHNACRLTCIGFRLYPFRSPLLRASLSISFPPVTEMFHFTGSPPLTRLPDCSGKVSPFGYPRINGCLLLPVAFRSLLRPSSASGARGIPRVPLIP